MSRFDLSTLFSAAPAAASRDSSSPTVPMTSAELEDCIHCPLCCDYFVCTVRLDCQCRGRELRDDDADDDSEDNEFHYKHTPKPEEKRNDDSLFADIQGRAICGSCHFNLSDSTCPYCATKFVRTKACPRLDSHSEENVLRFESQEQIDAFRERQNLVRENWDKRRGQNKKEVVNQVIWGALAGAGAAAAIIAMDILRRRR